MKIELLLFYNDNDIEINNMSTQNSSISSISQKMKPDIDSTNNACFLAAVLNISVFEETDYKIYSNAREVSNKLLRGDDIQDIIRTNYKTTADSVEYFCYLDMFAETYKNRACDILRQYR